MSAVKKMPSSPTSLLRSPTSLDPSVIIAADQSNGRSILSYQTNLDKIAQLTSHSMMGVSGPNCDLVNFTQYVSTCTLYEY